MTLLKQPSRTSSSNAKDKIAKKNSARTVKTALMDSNVLSNIRSKTSNSLFKTKIVAIVNMVNNAKELRTICALITMISTLNSAKMSI